MSVVLFGLGQWVATPGALSLLCGLGVSPLRLLARHARGDWGDVDLEDKGLNDEALRSGGRLLSSYTVIGRITAQGRAEQHRVWVTTEADRSVTTVLLPEEY